MDERFDRLKMLLGEESAEKLAASRVIVFGLGGVGGYALEALARSGVGTFGLVDGDVIAKTNINRQIIAIEPTVGMAKTAAAAERVRAINPDAVVREYNLFITPENADEFDFENYDFAVDAVDSVTAKIVIIKKAKEAGIPVISSMGTGNKLDPSALRIADISKTSVCPLARVMRRELKSRGITNVPVVFSDEEPLIPDQQFCENAPGKRSTPGSAAFVPPAAGLLIASYVVRQITGK